MSGAWVYVVIAIVVALVMLALDAWLEHKDRQARGRECSPMHPCPECQAEPPSRLDRLDGLR